MCSGCPRSYHYQCLDREFKAAVRGKMQFHCPQHQCADCLQKTGDAGGMIYRCRWCERGYCEDCLDFDKTILLGENLKEFELLGFPAVTQAFYISCPACKDHHAEYPEAQLFCEKMALQIDEQYRDATDGNMMETTLDEESGKAVLAPSRAESLTDATTLDDSGVSTPQREFTASLTASKGKRNTVPTSFRLSSPKPPTTTGF